MKYTLRVDKSDKIFIAFLIGVALTFIGLIVLIEPMIGVLLYGVGAISAITLIQIVHVLSLCIVKKEEK